MARITVEDCIEVVTNRFELVAVAAQRAKNLASGAAIQVNRDDDKNAVVALREIASRKVDVPRLREELISNNQKLLQKDILETETDSEELLSGIKEEMESLIVNDSSDDDDGADNYSEENLDVDD